jgi:hypothetical protein
MQKVDFHAVNSRGCFRNIEASRIDRTIGSSILYQQNAKGLTRHFNLYVKA